MCHTLLHTLSIYCLVKRPSAFFPQPPSCGYSHSVWHVSYIAAHSIHLLPSIEAISLFPQPPSGIATGVKGADCPLDSKRIATYQEKEGENQDKSGKRGKNLEKEAKSEGFCTLPLLTDKAGYATAATVLWVHSFCVTCIRSYAPDYVQDTVHHTVLQSCINMAIIVTKKQSGHLVGTLRLHWRFLLARQSFGQTNWILVDILNHTYWIRIIQVKDLLKVSLICHTHWTILTTSLYYLCLPRSYQVSQMVKKKGG